MGNSQPSKLLDSDTVLNLSFLDDGQFSKLYKGQLAHNRQAVTVKVPRVPENIRKEKKLVKLHIEEVKKLMPNIKRARSEYIVKYLGVSYDDFRKEVWIVREFIDGTDLETLLKNPSLCPALRSPEKKMAIAVGISKGISHLHNLRHAIIHGDFKLSDVLIPAAHAQSLTPKITNFGLWDFKQFFADNASPDHVELLNPCQAPEVLFAGERPTLFSDCWSLGAVILHWMMDLPPWDMQDLCVRYRYRTNRQLSALKSAMRNEEEPTVLQHLQGEDQELDFLKDCFRYQATDRPSAQVVEHKMVQASQTPTWTNLAYHKYYN